MHIYFIQGVDGGPVKIGASSHPPTRLTYMQANSPIVLQIIRVIENVPTCAEKDIHRAYAEHRLHGEWFDPAILNQNRTEWERHYRKQSPELMGV